MEEEVISTTMFTWFLPVYQIHSSSSDWLLNSYAQLNSPQTPHRKPSPARLILPSAVLHFASAARNRVGRNERACPPHRGENRLHFSCVLHDTCGTVVGRR